MNDGILFPIRNGEAIIDADCLSIVDGYPWTLWRGDDGGRYVRYSIRNRDGSHTLVAMHRLILGVNSTSVVVDHKNHNGLDNRRCNLRVANYSLNSANARFKSGTSGFRGVKFSKRSGRWSARIKVDGREHFLGEFASVEDAAAAYNIAASAVWGEFALLNDVPDVKPRPQQKFSSFTKGVYYRKDRKKWAVVRRENGKTKHCAMFSTEAEATQFAREQLGNTGIGRRVMDERISRAFSYLVDAGD